MILYSRGISFGYNLKENENVSERKIGMAKKEATVGGNKKLPQKSDAVVLEEIKKSYESKYLKPSRQVIEAFTKNIFTQLDMEYLIKYGERNKKYDFEKNGN
jgi:hypothetical protein